MKIIVVGGTGTIGKAVVKLLGVRHHIIVASQKHGDVQVDMTDLQSIENMYRSVGPVDAMISTTGKVHFDELAKMSHDHYLVGLHNKLMGQVNLVTVGLNHLNPNGSFTLTSGILSCDPIRYGVSASMVDGAIDSFVRAAAIEMPRGIRINSVSPTLLAESVDAYGEYFPGFEPVPAERVALAYSKSTEGAQTGQVYTVGY